MPMTWSLKVMKRFSRPGLRHRPGDAQPLGREEVPLPLMLSLVIMSCWGWMARASLDPDCSSGGNARGRQYHPSQPVITPIETCGSQLECREISQITRSANHRITRPPNHQSLNHEIANFFMSETQAIPHQLYFENGWYPSQTQFEGIPNSVLLASNIWVRGPRLI